MKKGQLKALFIEAKGTGQKYIGVMIQTEGSSEPEVIINPKENFNAKFDYYMAAYDDDLILIAAKEKKDIRITGAAAGASFEDIQSQLIDEKASSGWKEQIADAVDRVVDKMLKETPPGTEEERQNCETMRETIKGMFLTQRRSKTEAAFITENIDRYVVIEGTEVGKGKVVPFDELLTWSIANAKTISNSYGEIKIDKALDEDRIDPIDAIIDAWKAAMKEEYKPDTNEVVNEWLEMYEKYMGKGGEKE